MKNRQLMRLNKVLHKGEVKTVDCISPGYVSFIEDRRDENSFGYWVDLDDVEFIPLTDQLIRENNIEVQFEEVYICGDNSNGCLIGFESIDFWLKIKYLHQVQNLYFNFNGEDLELQSYGKGTID